MTWKSLLSLGCGLAAAVLAAGCPKPPEPPKQTPPTVTVAPPTSDQVTDSIDLTGTVSASLTVDLVARVSGFLKSVEFTPGTYVEAHKLLFVIEPDTYQQQLALAQAELTKAQAEYTRQAALMKDNATSASNVEKSLSERDQSAAQVELAKLNVGYTKVLAPFAGRITRNLVDAGNLVGAGSSTKLATLDQLVPIYVYFNMSERDALQIRDAMRGRNKDAAEAVGKAAVLVGLQNEAGYPHEGVLDYVGTGVSTSSGTVQMRAVFKNEDKGLLPGFFARVRIPLGQAQPMLVVPPSATGNDQEGDYVLVVDAEGIVARRGIVKGPLVPKGLAIRKGLAAEDRVIVKGLMGAKPGAKVVVTQEAKGEGATP
jgi:RND family efflux transporter MFP subunit